METHEDTEQTTDLSPSEELYRAESARNNDGTYEVTITDWERNGDSVTVSFELPTGETATDTMEWPWPNAGDPEEYRFVRICRQTGHGVGSSDALRYNRPTLDAEYTDPGWRLVAPPDRSLSDHLKEIRPTRTLALDAGIHTESIAVAILTPLLLVFTPLILLDPNEPGEIFTETDYVLQATALFTALVTFCLTAGVFYFFL